jgi:hypothetical protein
MTIGYVEVQMHLRDVEAPDIERILRVLNEMGGTYTVIEHTVTPAAPAPPDIPDPDPLPPNPPPEPEPPPKWWASLTITTPLTKIYSNVLNAQVYFSSDPDHAPSFEMKKNTSTGQPRTVPLDRFVEVWRAPLPLSGWICVANLPGEALWVRGEDMRAMP